MATKTETNVTKPMTRAELEAYLRKPVAQREGGLVDFLANRVADSGETFARIGAAFASSLDHASDAYALEKERQFQRRVDRLAKLANIVK